MNAYKKELQVELRLEIHIMPVLVKKFLTQYLEDDKLKNYNWAVSSVW